MTKTTYSDRLKHPLWQKKRLQILKRDKWKCKLCGDEETTLHVHHHEYSGGEPWEVENSLLVTLCEHCHTEIEQLKAEKSNKGEDFDFNSLRVFKSNNWQSRARIMFVGESGVGNCVMRIYDADGDYVTGFNLGMSIMPEILRVMKFAMK